MENPAALAGATGSNVDMVHVDAGDDTSEPAVSARPVVPLPGIFNRARFLWAKAVAEDDITGLGKALAYVIINQVADRNTAQCFWSYERFGKALNCSRDSVRRLFRLLEAAGWLRRKIVQSGRGTVIGIEFTIPAERAEGWDRPKHPGGVAPYLHSSVALTAQTHASNPGRGGAEVDTERASTGGKITPYRRSSPPARGVQGCPQRGAGLHPPYHTPNYSKKAAVSTSAAEPRKQVRAEQPASLPDKPHLPLAAVVPFGSDREADWNEWLRRNRFPALAELGVLASDATGRGYETPFRRPPSIDQDNEQDLEARIARRWANWALLRKGA
ncbi:helix-turn-helix domain-containing protein [Paenirhodobacter populi]|uniref:helix-turn-helix domain-containing protein n=1 Tax=Paenirhodobacter populi TaxID=2306993 RepID=UPI0013E33EA7|nr:helix-turn-helix domain-containing protein [Sinirhodobacter populi]